MPPIMLAELTRLRLGGAPSETHWTLAFEAAPYSLALHGPFGHAVAAFLRDWPLHPLTETRSMSYPGWLMRTRS